MDQREFNKLLGAIKRCFSRSSHRKAVLEAAVSKRKKGPRGGKLYKCAKCKRLFGAGKVQVDHISPIIPIGTPAKGLDWNTIVARTYCSPKNLQVLCVECHKKKSRTEVSERAKARKK